jgi:hypothetical protein
MSDEIPKVKIELTPFEAVQLHAYFKECMQVGEGFPLLVALHDSMREFQRQVGETLTEDQLQDALAEQKMLALLGKEPEAKDL